MTTQIRHDTRGLGTGSGRSRGREEDLHGRGDGPVLSGQSGKQGKQFSLSRENQQELEKLRLAWAGGGGPSQEVGRSQAEAFRWQHEAHDRDPARLETDWLHQVEECQLIAQYSPMNSLTALFEPAAAPSGPRHPLAENAEDIVRSLMDRLELNPLEKQAPRSSFELALDKSMFGISGIKISMTAGSLTVLLDGVADPAHAGLAAAGQQLVRDLQKNTGVRSVRLFARSEEADGRSGDRSEETQPATIVRRNEL